jgi:hypothetical protein
LKDLRVSINPGVVELIHKMLEKTTQSKMTPGARAARMVSFALLKPSMDEEKTTSVSIGEKHSHKVRFEHQADGF